MPYDFNIYHNQVTPSIPDYDTVNLLISSDLDTFASKQYVEDYNDGKYLQLLGGSLSGDLNLYNVGGIAKKIVLYSAEGKPVSLQAGITFVSALTSETGITIPGLLITDGRLDMTPDPIFNRAEFRIKGSNAQFNIFNINTFDFYMRVNPDTSFMIGQNTVALSAGAVATGVSTSAVNLGAFSQGNQTSALGQNSRAYGDGTIAVGTRSTSQGFESISLGIDSTTEGSGTLALGPGSHAEGNSTRTGRRVTFNTYTSATRVFTFTPTVSSLFNNVSQGNDLVVRIQGDNTPFKILNRSTITGNITADRPLALQNIAPSDFNYIFVNSGQFAHAEGEDTEASGVASHAEGNNTVASGSSSHAEGGSTIASGVASHAEGVGTVARGESSHAEGRLTIAEGIDSHAAGFCTAAVHNNSWIWRGPSSPAGGPQPLLSSTRTGQFMVSAEGGVALLNRVGIGTDSIANALTVVGQISATSTVFSSGAPVVVSTSTFETPTTGISAVNNIIALSQATYDALTVKRPNTFYIIV